MVGNHIEGASSHGETGGGTGTQIEHQPLPQLQRERGVTRAILAFIVAVVDA